MIPAAVSSPKPAVACSTYHISSIAQPRPGDELDRATATRLVAALLTPGVVRSLWRDDGGCSARETRPASSVSPPQTWATSQLLRVDGPRPALTSRHPCLIASTCMRRDR